MNTKGTKKNKESTMNRKGTKRHSQQGGRSNEDLMRRFVDDCRRTRRRTPDRSPHRRAGVFTELAAQNARLVFPRRRGSRIATITRWSGQTETGRATPRATPHARGRRESTSDPSDRYIKQEGRPFRVPGSQAPPRHRMTAPASTASTRRTGTRNAARFRMKAAILS